MNLSVAICTPPPPSIDQREIRKRPKTCKKIFFLPSQLFLICVRGPLLWIFGDGQAGFLHGGRTNHVYLIGKMVTIHGKVSQSKKFMKWKFPNGIFCPLFFRQRIHFKKDILKEWERCYVAFLIPLAILSVKWLNLKNE